MSASAAAVVVDLETYRQARRAAAAPATRPSPPRTGAPMLATPPVVPVLVWWVPVWPVA